MPTNKAKDKAEKAAFKLMKQAYKKKWGAALGKGCVSIVRLKIA